MSKPILLIEHGQITDQEDRQRVDNLGIKDFMQKPENGNLRYLGLSRDYTAGYYIGACNLSSDISLVVLPKIPMLGYFQMLLTAFRTHQASDYFASHYGIQFNEPFVECGIKDDYLTPLLIVSFVESVTRITVNGLKRGYVTCENNLVGKVRGKICITPNQILNVKRGRLERVYCRYQEYSVDIPENRLLKKALDFSLQYIASMPGHSFTGLVSSITRLQPYFSEVSRVDSAFEIVQMKFNSVFREYNTAINLAKFILKRFDFSLSESGTSIMKVPAYWIDMPALYEVYVYSLLDEAYPGKIEFQAVGSHSTRADFIKKDEGIILDAKYKPYYEESDKYIVDDIRELSGYARDEKLLKLMGYHDEDYIPPCVLIYPGSDRQFNFNSKDVLSQLQPDNHIRGYHKFFKLGVNLPSSRNI